MYAKIMLNPLESAEIERKIVGIPKTFKIGNLSEFNV